MLTYQLGLLRLRKWGAGVLGLVGLAMILVIIAAEIYAFQTGQLGALLEQAAKNPGDEWIPRVFVLGRAIVAAVGLFIAYKLVAIFDRLTGGGGGRDSADADDLVARLVDLVRSVRG